MSQEHELTVPEVAALLRVPSPEDDKYARGVLGVLTGSNRYPGAAVITVEAALRTGIGMVRYLGVARVADLVLQRRPEAVTEAGQVQAWLVGSGMVSNDLEGETPEPETGVLVHTALASGHPLVIDAGAISAAVMAAATGPTIITPHAGELARLTGADVAAVRADPSRAARATAELFGVTVLLKGHVTRVVAPGGPVYVARQAPTWLATAGAGDALAGILGALVATHAATGNLDLEQLARLGAAAAVVHGRAAAHASGGGPLTILDLCSAVPRVIAEVLASRGRASIA